MRLLLNVPEESDFYFYKAHITAVYDGDTVTADIDLGFNVTLKNQKLRLYGIDTPELRGEEREEGLKARDWLREQILDKDVYLESHKDKSGKYGRWLVYIWQVKEMSVSINDKLLNEGLAKRYDG